MPCTTLPVPLPGAAKGCGAMLVSKRSGAGASPTAAGMSPDPLPSLSSSELETLLAALDPRLDGFGAGDCLDDASAFLERLAGSENPPGTDAGDPKPPAGLLQQWLAIWRQAGGNRQTLALMVATLLAERGQPPAAAESLLPAPQDGGP